MRADSAGTDPADALNLIVVTALAERGISVAGVAPKPITTELLANADLHPPNRPRSPLFPRHTGAAISTWVLRPRSGRLPIRSACACVHCGSASSLLTNPDL